MVCFSENASPEFNNNSERCLQEASSGTCFAPTWPFDGDQKVTLTHIRHSEAHCAWIGPLFGLTVIRGQAKLLLAELELSFKPRRWDDRRVCLICVYEIDAENTSHALKHPPRLIIRTVVDLSQDK